MSAKFNVVKENLANFGFKMRKFLTFEEQPSGLKKLFSSLWAIVIGLFLSSLAFSFYSYFGKGLVQNPFIFISELFKGAFDPSNKNYLLLYFLVFLFSGLSIAVAFKSGYFNVGVAGQMTLPAIAFSSILITSRITAPSTGTLFLGLLIYVILGALCGFISGMLKAYFKIHEVISTIFLNWIIVIFGKWILDKGNSILLPKDASGDLVNTYFGFQKYSTQSYSVSIDQNNLFIILGIVVGIALAIGFWFMYRNSTIGYKFKMIGISKTNSEYIGVNDKTLTMSIMSISGLLAGLAGFFYFGILTRQVSGLSMGPSALGFEAIAVAMIAFNGSFAMLFSSLLYAIIYAAKVPVQFSIGIETEFYPLITGILIFIIAIGVLFNKFTPIKSTIKWFILLGKKEYKEARKAYKIKKRENAKKAHIRMKDLKKIANERNKEFKPLQKEYELKVFALTKELKKANNERTIEIYDEISKLKFAHIAEIKSAGLDVYKDFVSFYKTDKKENKLAYKTFKEELFQKTFSAFAIKKFFKNKEVVE